jgi:hypothetical protein
MRKSLVVGATIAGALLGLIAASLLVLLILFAYWFGCGLTCGECSQCTFQSQLREGIWDFLSLEAAGLCIGAISGLVIAKIATYIYDRNKESSQDASGKL